MLKMKLKLLFALIFGLTVSQITGAPKPDAAEDDDDDGDSDVGQGGNGSKGGDMFDDKVMEAMNKKDCQAALKKYAAALVAAKLKKDMEQQKEIFEKISNEGCKDMIDKLGKRVKAKKEKN